MSRRSSDGGNAPPPDVYVGLLFVSVTALVAGIILLILELNRYQWTMG